MYITTTFGTGIIWYLVPVLRSGERSADTLKRRQWRAVRMIKRDKKKML